MDTRIGFIILTKCFSFRFFWIKHYSYGTGLIGDNSADPLASKSRTLSTEEVSVGGLCYLLTSIYFFFSLN